MGLVRSNKNKLIDRGPDIQPQKKFTLDDLNIVDQKKSDNNRILEATTIKVNYKLRDKINALSLIGFGDNQKEVIDLLIDNLVESMTTDEKRKFDIQYQVLENKTIKTIEKKHKTKSPSK